MSEDPCRPVPDLARVLVAPDPEAIVLQEYVPLSESLDWALARAYWEAEGPRAFLTGDVPYAVNNDGRSAADAADVFVRAVAGAPAKTPLIVAELGAGSGLFAKLFLDAVLRLDRGVHDRLTYWVTDRSESMLASMREGPLFEAHRDRVRFRMVDALNPRDALLDMAGGPGVHAVFANYLLDNLPMSVLYEDATGLREMLVRACLDRSFRPAAHGFASVDAVLERVQAGDHATLVPLFGSLFLQADYREVDRATVPQGDALEDGGTQGGVILHSHGALDCLDGVVPCLAPGGFILLSDFGTGEPREDDPGLVYNLYGASIAVGVNFRQLARRVERAGARWVAPDSDSASVRSRLLVSGDHPEVEERFRVLFDGARLNAQRARMERIRELRGQGLTEQARSTFFEAVAEQPDNWVLLQEAVYFLVYDLNEYARGIELADAALAMNPVSPGLWVARGAARMGAGDGTGAEEDLRRGIALNPREVRGRGHLARILAKTGRTPEALATLAQALAADRDEGHRADLLELQRRVLDREGRRYRARRQRAANRIRGVHLSPPAPAPEPDE